MKGEVNPWKKLLWKGLGKARFVRRRCIPAWQRFLMANYQRGVSRTSAGAVARRLMLLTWEFPPVVTGGVYRPLAFARYSVAAGWETTVACGPGPKRVDEAGRYLEQLLPESVTVIRAEQDDGPHPCLLPRIDGGIMNGISLYEAAAAEGKGGENGIVLASGPPFSNFVAGAWLAQRAGWKLVLDYRDEWSESPFDFVEKEGVNRNWERRCLKQADMVLFTTPSQLVHAEKRFPELAGRRKAVVYNGWEPGDFEMPGEIRREQVGRQVTLAYLGNLGAMASPAVFFETLSKVVAAAPILREKLRLRLVGHKRPDALAVLDAFPYPEMLELVETIPKQEAIRTMLTADSLLLLNPVGLHRYIQGKLYEYLASGTPILVFGQGGEMGHIVRELDAGLVVSEGDATALDAALQAILMGTASVSSLEARRSWLVSRTREAQAKVLLEHLEQLRAAG